MFPLVVISQRNAAKMNNNLPGLQAIQLKLTEARQTGNQLEAAKYSHEMMHFMKDKNLNPLKNMIVPIAQVSSYFIYISDASKFFFIIFFFWITSNLYTFEYLLLIMDGFSFIWQYSFLFHISNASNFFFLIFFSVLPHIFLLL